jgi:hypothetical protein
MHAIDTEYAQDNVTSGLRAVLAVGRQGDARPAAPSPQAERMLRIMATKTLAVACAVVTLVSGCATQTQPQTQQAHYWTKPGATTQEFRQTQYQCLREASANPVRFSDGFSMPDYQLAVLCLRAHGWDD